MNKRQHFRFWAGILAPFFILAPAAQGQELTLDFGQLGKAKVQVSIPGSALSSRQALPVILVVSGFQTAKELAKIMSESVGNNILVAYEYPLEDKVDWLDWTNPVDNKEAALVPFIPLQIAAVLNWIRGPDLMNRFGVQADTSRMNTVAISLGIFFVPMALKVAQLEGIQENSVILAYAGARLNLVAEGQIKKAEGPQVAQFLSPVLTAATAPFEPANYVKDLHPKHFLILNALDDQIFPRDSQTALVETVPEPKEVISIPGLHIGLDQPERVRSTVKIFKDWLVKNGAVNP